MMPAPTSTDRPVSHGYGYVSYMTEPGHLEEIVAASAQETPCGWTVSASAQFGNLVMSYPYVNSL